MPNRQRSDFADATCLPFRLGFAYRLTSTYFNDALLTHWFHLAFLPALPLLDDVFTNVSCRYFVAAVPLFPARWCRGR